MVELQALKLGPVAICMLCKSFHPIRSQLTHAEFYALRLGPVLGMLNQLCQASISAVGASAGRLNQLCPENSR